MKDLQYTRAVDPWGLGRAFPTEFPALKHRDNRLRPYVTVV